jgi:cytochrome c peroxidase
MRKFALLLFLMSLIWFGFETNFGASPYSFRKLTFFPKMPVSLENPVTKEGALLGRYLFYDPVLSYDSSISCASCHKQEFAFSDSPRKLSKGKEGISMKRNTLPLFNLAWYSSLFWDGRAGSIEAQIFHPLQAKEEMEKDFKKTCQK